MYSNLTRTEYLFGKKKEEYECLEQIARERIADATALLRELAQEKKHTKHIDALMQRYREIEEARVIWQKILEVERFER